MDIGINILRDPWGFWDLDPDQQADLIAYHQILHAPHEEQQSRVRQKASTRGEVTFGELKWYLSHPTIYRDLAYIKSWENGTKTRSPGIGQQDKTQLVKAAIQKKSGVDTGTMNWWFNDN